MAECSAGRDDIVQQSFIRLAVAVGGAAIIASACSETTRYRVLSFFFDGVPPPASMRRAEATTEEEKNAAETEAVKPRPQPDRQRRSFPHPPYRDNRCDVCHSVDSGQLFRQPSEGLCLGCHAPLLRNKRFVHGPAAVNACLFCHHHHASAHEHVLRMDPPALCLQCHDKNDLSKGRYHENISQRACTDCHNPHASDRRYLLKAGGLEKRNAKEEAAVPQTEGNED